MSIIDVRLNWLNFLYEKFFLFMFWSQSSATLFGFISTLIHHEVVSAWDRLYNRNKNILQELPVHSNRKKNIYISQIARESGQSSRSLSNNWSSPSPFSFYIIGATARIISLSAEIFFSTVYRNMFRTTGCSIFSYRMYWLTWRNATS